MLTSKKGFTTIELVVVIAVAVILAAGIAVSFVTINNKTAETADLKAQVVALEGKLNADKDTEGLTEADVEAAIAAELAKLENVTTEEVSAAIKAAINSYKMRDLTSYDVQLMIDNAIAKMELPAGGLDAAAVEKIVSDAIAAIELPDGTPAAGLTEAQVKAIVDNAVAALKNELSATAVTKAQMEQAIADALKNVTPGTGLTEAQVKAIVNNAIAGIDTGLSYYEVQALIDAAIAALKNEQPQQPTTPADLKSALQAGGTYAAAGNVALSDVNIPQNVTSVLDLKGYTLTVRDEDVDDSISVLGSLTVTNGTIVIERPTAAEAVYQYAGLCVEAGGALNFDNVTIIGDRLWNVANSGTLQLTNSKFTVESGYGIKNYGAAVVKNCTMVANGEATSQIYSTSGTVDVTGTSFVEGSDFESYYYAAPIESHYASVVTLEGVNITTTGADEYSVWAGNGGKVVIKSGTINSKPACVNDSTVTIYGGTINGVAFADITAASDIFAGAGCKLTQGTNCWIISQ